MIRVEIPPIYKFLFPEFDWHSVAGGENVSLSTSTAFGSTKLATASGMGVVLFLSVAAGEEALGTFHSKNCHGFLKSVASR